ncbi:MAG: hypothetical protein MUC31_08705 [Bacteroidales bacterium]|nr:hypothetical protein [Bacteroidales bacterium]
MKRIFYIIFSLLLIDNCYSQYSATIKPSTSQYWTGYFKSDGSRANDEIWVGKPTIGLACRGFICFDLSALPSNACITGITLYLYPYNPAGSNHHLEIHEMIFDPRNSYGPGMWDDCADGTTFYSGTGFPGNEQRY